MAWTRTSDRRRALKGALAVFLAAVAVGIPAGAAGGDPQQQTLHVAQSGIGAERVKTVPISKKKGKKQKVVMSLSPGDVGPVRAGDAAWGGGEFEISVTCLEPIPKCVGKIYRYSPRYRAQIVLAPGPGVTDPSRVTPLTGWRQQKCSQELPHRNHHCVIAVSGQRQIKGDPVCEPRCYVNMILDAYHSGARNGNVVVIGADEDNGIEQDKGTLDSAVFKPGPPPDTRPLKTTKRSRSKLGIGGGGAGPKGVLYSQKLRDLKDGEQLLVEAQATQKIGSHGYSVLMQSQLIVSNSPTSTRRNGVAAKVTKLGGVVTAQNGFNCTQGRSGHSDPCKIRKVGVVELIRDAVEKPLSPHPSNPVPLYINLVVQNRIVGVRGGWRSGDAAKIPKRGGFVEVQRYGPEFHE